MLICHGIYKNILYLASSKVYQLTEVETGYSQAFLCHGREPKVGLMSKGEL